MPTDEQVFGALKASMTQPTEESAEQPTEKLSVMVDAGLRRVEVPDDGKVYSYPLLTPFELDAIQGLGNGSLRAGKIIWYIVWLSQRRGPGHRKRVFDATRGEIPRRMFYRMFGARWIDRVTNTFTNRRSYNGQDAVRINAVIIASLEWCKKKQDHLAKKATLTP
jgi:hypothetical protein